MSGDEKPGEEVYCSFCRAPLIVGGSPEAEETELEEDY
jgi:hypothetical protein